MKDAMVVGEFEYVLRWFTPGSDVLIGEEMMPHLSSLTVRQWFGIGDDESPIECYPVLHTPNLEIHDYFIEGRMVER